MKLKVLAIVCATGLLLGAADVLVIDLTQWLGRPDLVPWFSVALAALTPGAIVATKTVRNFVFRGYGRKVRLATVLALSMASAAAAWPSRWTDYVARMVWGGPMRTLAIIAGIIAVALLKILRRKNIA